MRHNTWRRSIYALGLKAFLAALVIQMETLVYIKKDNPSKVHIVCKRLARKYSV